MKRSLEGIVLLFILAGALAPRSEAQEYTNLLIILDGSGSMAAHLGGDVKMDVAKGVVKDLVENLPAAMNVGLIVYGARSPRERRDCTDIELVQPVGRVERERFRSAVDGIQARGMTPIGAALRAGGQALDAFPGDSTIVLVTDGVESCDADPCATAREVHERTGIDIRIQVVGLALNDADRQRLECVAAGGGGQYYPADSAAELRSAVAEAIKPPPPQRGGQRAMWWSILHPGLGEWKNSGKSFEEGCPPRKFWLGLIPGFGWPGYLQVISAIDAYHGRTNDWSGEFMGEERGSPAPR